MLRVRVRVRVMVMVRVRVSSAAEADEVTLCALLGCLPRVQTRCVPLLGCLPRVPTRVPTSDELTRVLTTDAMPMHMTYPTDSP